MIWCFFPSARTGVVYAVEYTLLRSVLLFTLLENVHCQPGVMFRVSLLPVANVDASDVQNEPVAANVQPGFAVKSRTNAESVKPAGSGVFNVPFALTKLSQS